MNLTKDQELVCGINAVNEIISIRPSSVRTLFIEDDKGKRIQELDQLAKQNNIEVVLQDSSFFQKNFSEMNHQSVAIICHKRLEENENFLENLFKKKNLLLLILEHITDPHNVGACIRTAAAAGVDAIIVVAGMEGALATLVSTLVDIPIIGIPTSVGYGYGEKGIAALASMLQSCSLGLSVVNIDNGIAAGGIAANIANRVNKKMIS